MGRRISGFFIAFLLMVLVIFQDVSYAKVQSVVHRDTILVMDVSYSMSGKPFDVMKKSVKKFIDNYINTSGDNRIGIITYSSDVKDCFELSNANEECKNKVYSFIDGLQVDGTTNLYQGISKAYEMLRDNGSSNVIRNIVVLTDGIPNRGLQTENKNDIDRYLSYDLTLNNRGLAKRSGALYHFYKENLEKDFNVYTLGFFHSLNEKSKIFGKVLLEDIQNKGYYEVTDPYKLEFAFGEISEDVSNSEENCPIIIVPGVMGSRLFDNNGFQWWQPEVDKVLNWYSRLDDNLKMDSKLYLKGNYDKYGKPVNQAKLTNENREYGALSTYKVLLNSIINEFNTESNNSRRAVYFFSYDFRQDNTITESLLKKFIDDILSDNNNFSKVDIVAHSMGGLICSKYVKNNGMSKIRKLITLSTPYEGSPKLIKAVLTKEVTDSFVINSGLQHIGNLNTDTKSSFPAIAQLVPTSNYFKSDLDIEGKSDLFVYQYDSEGWSPIGDFMEYYTHSNKMNNNDYDSINTRVFKSNFNKAKQFHNSLIDDNNYNILLDYDNTYFAIGVNQSTIKGLTYCEKINKQEYEKMESYRESIKNEYPTVSAVKEEVKGDGTVPYYSLTMGGNLEKLRSERFAMFDTTHTGMVGYVKNKENLEDLGGSQEAEVIKWVLNLLGNRNYNVSSSEVNKRKYTVIRIACPVDVKVESNGETLSSSAQYFKDRTSFGSIELLGEKGDIKTVVLYDGTYSIQLMGIDSGSMDCEVSYFDEDENEIEKKEFLNIPVIKGMDGYLNTSPESATINLDYDGDGEYEYILNEGSYANIKDSITYSTPSNVLKVATSSNLYKSTNSTSHTDRKPKVIYKNINSPVFLYNTNIGWNVSVYGDWYYIIGYDDNKRPIFKTGWHKEQSEGKWYYLSKADNKMLIGTHIIDGKRYKFRDTGNAVWKYDGTKKTWKYVSGISRGSLDEE